MEDRALRWLMAVTLFGLALSVYLTVLHVAVSEDGGASFCALASFLSCARILSSSYATVGPVPLAVIGAAGFAVLFALALWRFVDPGGRTRALPTTLFYGAALGLGYELAVTLAAAAELRAACPVCLVVLGVIATAATLAWRLRRAAADATPPSAAERGRRRRVVVRMIAGGTTAIAVLLAVALVQTASAPMSGGSARALTVGRKAPLFQARDVNGQWHRLDDYVGRQPILVEFLWTFCPHCRAMAPTMRELAAAHHGDLTILSVVGDPRDRDDLVRDFVEQYAHGWPYLLADTSVLVAYGIKGYPTFVVIDTAGRVRSTLRGEVSRQRLEEAVRAASVTRKS